MNNFGWLSKRKHNAWRLVSSANKKTEAKRMDCEQKCWFSFLRQLFFSILMAHSKNAHPFLGILLLRRKAEKILSRFLQLLRNEMSLFQAKTNSLTLSLWTKPYRANFSQEGLALQY